MASRYFSWKFTETSDRYSP